MITGRAPASLFRLVNVDMNWVEAIPALLNSVERVQKLFDVFRDGDAVSRVKVVFCLKRLWETRVFESCLSQMLERCSSEISALVDLYNVAVILSLEVPNSNNFSADIFPYGSTASHWVTSAHDAHVEAVVRSIVCSYYIRIIHNIFMMNAVANMHHIKPILSKYNQLHQSRVSEIEGGVGRLCDEVFFPLIGSARSSACALGVFLVVQVLSSKNPKLEAFAHQHDFMTPLRMGSQNFKFSHSKWGCTHLMKMLLSGQNMLDFAIPCYNDWYLDAAAPGDFDTRHLLFRMAFEFAHTVLRDGYERGCPPDAGTGRKEERWDSPLRHALVMRSLLDGLSDLRSPNRVLRCTTILKLLLQEKWTNKKDLASLVSMPDESSLPHRKVDNSAKLEGGGKESFKTLHKKGSRSGTFFRLKLTTSRRKDLSGSSDNVDSQVLSGLCSLPDKVLQRVLTYLMCADLFVLSCVCWKLNHVVHGAWKQAFSHEVLFCNMRPHAISTVGLSSSKKPADEQLA